MHSVAMNAGAKNARDSRLTVIQPSVRTNQPSGRFIRLSQLRRARDCQQVAAVCYQLRDGSIEFLLIQTRGSRRWTFPKGSAEAGLTHAQAAALEAFEEAGVHGRIEENSFTRYLRRREARKSGVRSAASEVAVNAYLCEVLRLANPKESNRNRTWFSVEDARRCLRERRRIEDGNQFARVIDRAVARIQRLRSDLDAEDDQPQNDRPRYDSAQKDALQRVQFEASEESDARFQQVSFMPYSRRIASARGYIVSTANVNLREAGEVLRFSSPPQTNRIPGIPSGPKKVKALGTGAKKD